MTPPHWLPQARRLRDAGYSFAQIGLDVDAPKSTVARWLDTDAEECPTCGAAVSRWRKHCSRACSSAAAVTSARRICRYCGGEFQALPSQEARGRARYCSVRCARQAQPPGHPRFISERARACQNPECPGGGKGKLEQHHVVYEQHVRVEGGNPGDPRDGLTLCTICHTRHHRRVATLRVAALRDENFDFARELLGGPKAYEYLRRRYAGEDGRLLALLNEEEE